MSWVASSWRGLPFNTSGYLVSGSLPAFSFVRFRFAPDQFHHFHSDVVTLHSLHALVSGGLV